MPLSWESIPSSWQSISISSPITKDAHLLGFGSKNSTSICWLVESKLLLFCPYRTLLLLAFFGILITWSFSREFTLFLLGQLPWWFVTRWGSENDRESWLVCSKHYSKYTQCKEIKCSSQNRKQYLYVYIFETLKYKITSLILNLTSVQLHFRTFSTSYMEN